MGQLLFNERMGLIKLFELVLKWFWTDFELALKWLWAGFEVALKWLCTDFKPGLNGFKLVKQNGFPMEQNGGLGSLRKAIGSNENKYYKNNKNFVMSPPNDHAGSRW